MDPELKQLEVKRLLKKLDYVISDYEYQSRLMDDADRHFQTEVNRLLNDFPDLKSLYDENNDQISSDITSIEEDIENKDELKGLYRKIVKVTHPDKTQDLSKNMIFDKASKAYESGDIVDMILLAENLNIESGIEIPIDKIKLKISDVERKTEFLKKTYTWKWMNSSDDKKDHVIVEYLRQNII